MKYKQKSKAELEEIFIISCSDRKFTFLRYGRSHNTIKVKIPFVLDEDCASLAGLMPDGSLIKDLMRIYFHQKKDLRKIYLFRDLLIKVFKPSNKIFIREGNNCFDAYTNSQTLARFFYHILGIPKSDEPMRVPCWVFDSPKSVKLAYLKQAFDMEGTVLKSLCEIRFISKDEEFVLDLQKLLYSINITSHINKRIGGTYKTTQYRLSIYRKENFARYKEIGFRIPFLKDRFDLLLKKYDLA